jgi:HAD superfamily hydrolase (TIGR01509 family)
LIRGIAFDLFDTLVDQNHHRLSPIEIEGRRVSATTPALHHHAVATYGIEVTLAEFAGVQRDVDRDLFRDTVKQGVELSTRRRFEVLVERLGLEGRADLPSQWTQIHMGMLREAITVPSHHESILASLAIDHRLAICSNFSDADTARLILDEAGFSEHLSSIVISEETGIRKPRPEIFRAVVDALGVPPEQILHVGDDLDADVAGAAACGMRTVWLTRQVADPDAALDAYEGPAPDFALEDLVDLPVLAARLSV